jgi:hypothetical protein
MRQVANEWGSTEGVVFVPKLPTPSMSPEKKLQSYRQEIRRMEIANYMSAVREALLLLPPQDRDDLPEYP